MIRNDGQVRAAFVDPAFFVAAGVLRVVVRDRNLPALRLAHVFVLVDAAFDAGLALAIAEEGEAHPAHFGGAAVDRQVGERLIDELVCRAPAGRPRLPPPRRVSQSAIALRPVSVSVPRMKVASLVKRLAISPH